MEACETPPEDLARMNRECWNTRCHRRALTEVCGGYRYCLKHWWTWFRDKEQEHWFLFRTTRLYWG